MAIDIASQSDSRRQFSDTAILERLRTITSGMLVDALAMAHIRGGIAGVRPARGFEDARIVGPAHTVLFGQPQPNSVRVTNYHAIRAADSGSVLVIAGGGVDGHFTGDNQAACAQQQGLQGIVVDGGARDLAGFRQLGLPLYCTGSAVVQPEEAQCLAYGIPIEVAGVRVEPGDFVLADEDGVVVVPRARAPEVLEHLTVVEMVEAEFERAIGARAPVEELVLIAALKKPRS